jgi:hypothetical protein
MVSKRNKDKHVQDSGLDWINKLAQEINPSFPPEGEGWLTLGEVCKKLNRGTTVSINLLTKLKAEKKKFLHIGVDGRRLVLVHYRIK